MSEGGNPFGHARESSTGCKTLMRLSIGSLLFLLCLALSTSAAFGRPDEVSLQKNRAAADAFFTNGVLLRLQIEIAEDDVASLRKEPRKYVKAVIRDGETVYTNVNIHLKGSVGSFRPIDEKPGWTINLKPSDPASSFHGLKKFHLNNCMQDGSYMSEWICGEMFRSAGVPATRAAHALVELNGRKLGLYVLLESMNKDFLARYFSDTDGNVYGQSQSGDITDALERMEGKGENTRADLKALAAAAQELEPGRLHARLKEVLDIDGFLSFMAMEVMLCHWDGYTFATHNYRVYHDPDAQKTHFLPHDFDQMMMEPKSPIHPGARGIIARDMLKIPETRARYRERLGTLFTNVFVVPKLTNRFDSLLAKIMPAIAAHDPAFARGMKTRCEELKDRIVQRAQAIEEQLKTPPPENLVLQVNVMDAETLMLVPRCTVIPGFYEGKSNLSWDRTHIYRALRGSFILDVAEARLPQIPGFFKFEADGYLPSVVSYRLSTNAEDAVFTVELKKGSRLSGSVCMPDGSPARGAEVVLLTETGRPILSQAQFVRQPGLPLVRVLDRGRFSFAPDPEAHSVVIAHEDGFMEAPVESLLIQPQAALQPWGCIEIALAGNDSTQPAFETALTSELCIPKFFSGFYSGYMRLNPADFTAALSASHPVSFTRVPPGDLFLWRFSTAKEDTNSSMETPCFSGRQLAVKPGATNHIVWGRHECSLTGRLSLEAQDSAIHSLGAKKERHPMKLGILTLTQGTGDTGPFEYYFNLDENGRFRVPCSESGGFQADLRLYTPPILLGAMKREIVLSTQPGSATESSVDLGLIELKAVKPAQTGDPAPQFSLFDAAGTPLRLSDFRGRFVLLSFWATWRTPQFTLLPRLKEVWKTHQNDSRFAMISLSLDRTFDIAQRYAARNSMPWKQGHAGEWFRTSLLSEYGVTDIPSAVLIGPDGRILSQNIAFSSLADVVKNALSGS